MNEFSFDVFFKKATGHDPYPFQMWLATGEMVPELIDVPTGMSMWPSHFDSFILKSLKEGNLVAYN